MADSAVANTTDNTKNAHKPSADTHHVAMTNEQMAAHGTLAKPTDNTGGKLEKNGSINCGDTAALYGDRTHPGTKDAGTEKAPVAGDSPPAEKEAKPRVDDKTDPKKAPDHAADNWKEGDAPLKRSDNITYKTSEKVGDKDVQAARQNLETAENGSKMSDALKETMRKNMDDLEHRLPPATAEQVKGVYDAATRLIKDEKGESQLRPEERNRLASDILGNAAQQHEIDQGSHMTCNVTTIEETLNRQSPDKAANMVADTALHGYYQAPDSKRIQLDPKSLKPDAEANIGETKSANGDRNYASQIFDMATVNDHWQRHDPPAMYTQVPGRNGQADTGERLVSMRDGQELTGPDGRAVRSPNIGTEAIAGISNRLGMDTNVISTKEFQASSKDGATGEHRAENYDDFKKSLIAGLKDKENGTATVFVNGHDQLFSNKPNNGDNAGGHVVTVSDYKAGPPEQVYMRNQWGAENNKWVSVAELYNASLPPESNNRVDSSEKPVNHVDRSQVGEHNHSGGGGGGGGGNGGGHDSLGSGHTFTDGNGHTLNAKEYEDFENKIKKGEPADDTKQKPRKGEIDYDRLGQLNNQLESFRQSKNDSAASDIQKQIDQVLSAGN